MTQFNFALSTQEDFEQEINRHKDLFKQIEVIGYIGYATFIKKVMEEYHIEQFEVSYVDSDYEGGWDIRLSNVISSKNAPNDFDIGYMVSHHLAHDTYKISDNVLVDLYPQRYLHQQFTCDLDNIMSKICPVEIYQAWSIFKNKSELENNIQTLPIDSKTKKIDFKI